MCLHSECERFRGTLPCVTPDGDRSTLIVLNRASRVWLTFDGAVKSTATMTKAQADDLVGLINSAVAA